MTGPEHYAKAQDHLILAAAIETDGYEDSMSAWHQRQAQVHATLALAAATALGSPDGQPAGDSDDWNYVASAGIVGVIEYGKREVTP